MRGRNSQFRPTIACSIEFPPVAPKSLLVRPILPRSVPPEVAPAGAANHCGRALNPRKLQFPFMPGSRTGAYHRSMWAWRIIGAFALVLMVLPPASAAERLHCFSRNDQRAAIADGRAVPLATAMRSLGNRGRGELVRARLCEDKERLVYQLTVLPPNGKVRRAIVDASNGTLVSER